MKSLCSKCNKAIVCSEICGIVSCSAYGREVRVKHDCNEYLGLSCLKPAAECLAVAKALKIGLSPMQIEAIINGGVPPERHGLPVEMFE